MHVVFHVEEPSAEAALEELLPKILGSGATWKIHPYQGKRDLLAKLPFRLRSYVTWLPADWYIVVLIDEDREDCLRLKAELDQAALDAGLGVRGRNRGKERSRVITRIAVEELEAWLLGDIEALVAAFPGVPRTLNEKRGYRDPDAVTGGTWEALERVLKHAGYFQSGLPKIEVARRVAREMEPSRNRSHSFQCFRDILLDLVGHSE